MVKCGQFRRLERVRVGGTSVMNLCARGNYEDGVTMTALIAVKAQD